MVKITEVKGVGVAIAKKLTKLGINSTLDALFHLPLRYQDRTQITPISLVQEGQEAQIEGIITDAEIIKRGYTDILIVNLKDKSGDIDLCFFRFSDAQLRLYAKGRKMRCFGEVRFNDYKDELEMYHPECTLVNKNTAVDNTLSPIYSTTKGLNQWQIRKIMAEVVKDYADELTPELLPPSLNQNLSLKEAVLYMHNPPPNADLAQIMLVIHPAQKRIIVEELLVHQLAYNTVRQKIRLNRAPQLSISNKLQDEFLANLGFTLTNAQQKVTAEIKQDLAQKSPMLRLVQGDVGSGKTVVAAMAALQAISSGYQVALMAPTEILAEQHYITFKKWFEPLGLDVAFLMSKLKVKEKRTVLAQIEQGVSLVIGTHALFQESVKFAQLGLIIIDEQHRFGVQQRLQLRNKGSTDNFMPHQLIMTATPIPRTLTMSIYADLDHSIIDEQPPNRTPVKTAVLNNEKREQVIERVKNACKEGRQVYWVCPLIEESEDLNCQAAISTAAELQKCMAK